MSTFPDRTAPPHAPLVTCIIGTKNSAATLELCLAAIKRQTYPEIEIVVVDNYSDDATVELARRFTDRVFVKGPERTVQWNHAIEQSRGECIQLLAADAEMTPEVVAQCVALYRQGHGMVIIPEKHVGSGFWARARALERECYLGDDTVEAPWFFSKAALQAVGCFDVNMIAGEDWDLFNRLKKAGFNYARCEAFIHHHLGRLRAGDAIRKKFYYAGHLKPFIRQNRLSAVQKIPLFRMAYIRHWRKLLAHPLLTAGFLGLKACESAAVATALLFSRRAYAPASPYQSRAK